MKAVLSGALAELKPSGRELESEINFARLLLGHIQGNLPPGCEAVLTGSVAKRTFLRDKRDVDIFILTGRSTPRESLEPIVKGVMASAFPGLGYQLSYAEHPYIRFHFEGRRIDLVPAYKISDASERLSAVDRSVLHTSYVMRNLAKKQRDDVLLLKQFLRANSIYGAEIKVGGFSGYLCELLIIRYGGFVKLLRSASGWKEPVFIDLKGYYKKKDIAASTARFASGLVVIDPTDKNRNVAAAVTKESLRSFISLCKSFLKKPSDSFFFRKQETFDEQAARLSKGRHHLLLTMPRPDVVDDVLWGQLNKLTNQLEDYLEGFAPKHILVDDSRHLVRIALILGKDRLSDRMLVAGPPLSMKEHVEQFKRRHKKARFVIKKRKIFADVKRPEPKAEQAIRAFFHSFAKSRSHLAYPEEMVLVERIKA
jgi:tRNA nucleotidyltransferase (CCA-adding enzyme)